MTNDHNSLLSATEAASFLGISPRLLWTLTHQKKISHVRIARRVLFERHVLSQFAAANRVEAVA